MKFLRLAILGLLFSGFSFAVNKDLLEVQRDLTAKLSALQDELDSRISTLAGAISAIQSDSRHTAEQVASMQDALRTSVTNALAPVSGLNNKIESTSEDVRSLRDALADLSARLERMDAKITDLKNQIQIMQNPPAAPANPASGTTPPGGVTGAPGQQGPPMGMSAEKSYTDARRDQQTGNIDLAYQEYQQYLTYFPNTEQAANAQYYIGEINYSRKDYKAAVKAFDAVLERYPNNPKTADAHLMKGMALAKDGQRTSAVTELRSLIRAYPNTEDARKAAQALRDPQLFPSAATHTAQRREDY